jgi:hypothetical protein
LIQDGVSGFLIKPSSKEAIIQSIAKHLDLLSSNAEQADKPLLSTTTQLGQVPSFLGKRPAARALWKGLSSPSFR